MRKRSSQWVFMIGVFLLPFLVYAGYLFYQQKFQPLPVYGKGALIDEKQVDHTIPAFELVNQDSTISTLNNWNDKIVIADFFFTHCPTICPKMTNSLKKVQKAFSEKEIWISSFSVDPERDNAARLKWYSGKFQINTSNWQLLTGDKKEIYKLARNGFMIVATDGDGGPGDFIHSEKLVLVDKQKRIRGYYDGTSETEINQLIKDIKKLKDETKISLVFILGFLLLGNRGSARPEPPVAEGKTIFTSRCAACHNINKIMTGPALAGVSERRSIDWIINFVHSSQAMVKKGDKDAVVLFEKFKIPMPDHPDLTDENIKNIVEYIKSESKPVGEEKAPFAKPSQRKPGYVPLSLTRDYGFFISFLVVVLMLISTLLFAVHVRNMKGS